MSTAEYQKQWRKDHAEEQREYFRRYNKENRERIREQKHQQYLANREQVIADVSRRYRENPQPTIDRAAAWVKANPEKHNVSSSKWSKANRDKTRATWHRRKAKIKGVGGTYEPSDIDKLYEKQCGVCASCSVALETYEIDHIMPIHLGGSNWPENLQLLCVKCNRSKGHKHPEKWKTA